MFSVSAGADVPVREKPVVQMIVEMLQSLNVDEQFVVRNINERFVRLLDQNTKLKHLLSLDDDKTIGLSFDEKYCLDDNFSEPHCYIEEVCSLVATFGERGCNFDVLKGK